VGDFGFLLGIALILTNYGSLDYAIVFSKANTTDITLICLLLFVGAMGKSAQFPLHVWLPDSMEGPTPISALIHAATMVTAGIFMVARMSPLFELSETARSVVLVIGAITALFMGLVALTQFDIKRVVAYSTLSQLGYMTVALGVSDYAGGIFHLMTHACFKALLFLGAGSAIIAMHHDQDMRNMGGLAKYMPITYVTMLIGSLALCGIPPFAGFFSKDAIIEVVRASTIPGHSYAYIAVVAGVFVTAVYTFRMMFMTFHGQPRYDTTPHPGHVAAHGDVHADDVPVHHGGPPAESPWVVTIPLIALAIPSVCIGWMTIEPMLVGDFFGSSILVLPQHAGLESFREEWHGVGAFMLHGVAGLPFWLALAGIVVAWYCCLVNAAASDRIAKALGPIYTLLDNKYYFDRFNDWFFAGGARALGSFLSNVGDRSIIDGFFVNGSAKVVGWAAALMRHIQSGYVYHYAFTMIVGVFALLTWWTH
jgi:NADH-quinone oxidoreductase subunit L